MLDNVFSNLRRGVERVRVRGEEAYQTGRLRLEIFNLHREQDVLFGRLGRAYHGGSDPAVLAQIQLEIRRIDEEVRSREALIEELSRPVPAPPAASAPPPATPTTSTVTTHTVTVQAPALRAHSEVNAMSDDPSDPSRTHVTDLPKLDTNPAQPDPAENAGQTSDSTRMEAGLYRDPDSPDIPPSPLLPESTDTRLDRESIKNAVREGDLISKNPDPLDKQGQ